ncbi:MAG: glycosyltransferase family 4 protein [Candidatus Omnitrophica bacterium]|nr:glycosyltransferase family 4 protein [Candidatus Omnitrophota bacterium]MCM8826268.1 glycosyltransferase family 4 protein [Candidatus Omnitrophota bacterium]
MRIVILTSHLRVGGITRHVIDLAKGLFKNNKVWVVCSGGEGKRELDKAGIDFKYIPLNTKSILSIKVFYSLILLIIFAKRNKIDLIHAHTRVAQFLAFLVYKILGIKYVSTFHGFYRPHIFRKLMKFEGIKTIAVSNAVKEHLIKDLKVANYKIEVIYNGIDRQASLVRKYRKIDFGFSEDTITLGILGRISLEKGHFLVVEAFNLLKEKYKNAYLLVCGKGKLENKLKVFVEKLHLKERVKFFLLEGREFLDIVDILLVASFKEGFGYTILEAFAKGVCVVGFSTGGIKEIIRDRYNGLLFYEYKPLCLKDVIEEFITNNNLRERIRENAKLSLNDFSYKLMVSKTEEVYRQLVCP